MMKKFTHGFLAFVFALACTATFAQSYAYAPTSKPTAATESKPGSTVKSAHTSSDVMPEVQQSMRELLRKSTNEIYFEKNVGQFHNPAVMYGFRTHFGSMGVYQNKLRLVSRQGEGEKPGQIDDNEENEIHIVDITFPGSTNNWTVEAGAKSATIGSYFENGKGMHPDLFNEITLKNVYPGVDLRLYSGKSGAMEFDWLVAKASDYEKIKLNFVGQDGLNIGKEGNLEIKLHDFDMKMIIPETYQILDGGKVVMPTRMEKLNENTLCYKISGKINPNAPLVIDPVMIWSSFMMNNSDIFDEYLYAVASNPAGETYCAGAADQLLSTTYMSNVSPGFKAGYSGASTGNGTSGTTSECVVYKFNAAGTAILAWTYTGIVVTVNNGQTNPLPLVPTDLDIFPNGRVLVSYSQDLIQIYSNTLAAQFYSGSVNSSGTKPTNANYQSVCIVDDATFYISGVTTTAYPTIVPANAPDPNFAGSSEGIIMRITNANSSPVLPLASWGTYVGGDNSEGFASIALSNDHTKLAFAVHTIVGATYPATVNAVDATPGAAGSTEILVGVIPVSATAQTAFSVFSYLGGSGDEGRISDVPQSDKAVVCADNNYFYVGGNTYSTDIPGRATGVQPALKGGIDEFISRIPWNGSAGTGFTSTYNGGSKVDLVGGIAVDFRSSDVLLFGTTSSNADFPVLQTTPASPYYQNTFGGGTYDISYGSFSNDLTVRSFGTYIGGNNNDYLGSTGVLRGSGHLFYNLNTGLINIGTTVHSNETTIPVQWVTNIPGFDKTGGANNNDNHFIFQWDPNTFDYGDAPAAYELGHPAKSALSTKIRLGLTIDAESTPFSSADGKGDDNNNSGSADDEDGVATIPVAITGATTYSVSVSVYNNSGATVKLAGWLDANNNQVFDFAEFASVNVPSSASQQTVTLPFTGLVPQVYGSGNTFLRLRISDGALTALSDTGEVQAGEVEDYQVCIKPNAGVDQTVCLVGTATMAATGAGTWTAQAGNPGTATITTPSSPTTTISGFSTTGTYHFIFTNSTGCTDTANVIVTTQPGAVTITPATVNICVGNTATLTANVTPAGGTYSWTPVSFISPAAANTQSVTVNPPATQTYNVVYTLGGCNSSASRLVTVYPVVTANAGVDQTYCSNVSTTVTLGGSPTASGGSGSFTYAWSPPTRLSATNVANPTITSIVSSTTTYYVTVTDNLTGCTSVDSMKLTINPSVTVSIAVSDTDLCLGQFTSLAATGTPAGGTYTWSPTVGMTPAAGNTATVSVAPSGNQVYTVVYSLAGCTNSATRGVNVYPNVNANAGVDQTFCLPVASTITLGGSPTASGGSGSFTYAWSPNTRLSSTNVANPTITSAVASAITYYVTVTDTKSGCTSVDSMVLTINSQATVTITSPDTNLCAGQASVLTASGAPAGGTYQWSPVTNMTPAAGNTAVVSVSPPVGSQTYIVTYTTAGCSGTAHKTVNVVPAVVAHSGGDQTYCMPYASTITLGGSPATATGGSGSFSYSWSPTTRLSNPAAANPTLTSNVASTIKYFVTVTDNVSGCTSVDSMTLTLNPAVVANAGTAKTTCAGIGVVIGGAPTGSGGTGTLTYSWTPTGGLSASNVSNPTATPAVLTTYTVVVTDTKSCSASSSVQVTVSSVPTADAGPVQTLTDCSAASVNIGGAPTATGGAGGYTYSWSPTGGLDFANVANPNVSHIASNTIYSVTVTDSKGCTASASTRVNVTTSTMQIDAGLNASYCANSGGSATFNGVLTGSGTGPFTYQWSPTANLNPTNSINTIANPSAAGVYIYTLNVTDANGCNASDTVRLDVWPVVAASAGTNVAVCSGFGRTIGGSPTGIAGSGSFSYAWSPVTGLNSSTIPNPIATPAGTTPYTVTVTDLHSCTAVSTALVTVNSNPVAHAGTDQTYCLPVTSTIKLGAVPSATGGTGGPYAHSWTPTANLSSATAANPIVTVSGASVTTYKLVVRDVATGCTNLDSTHLTILAQPTVSVASADTDLCNGQTSTLTATGTPTGGTYQWAPLLFIVPGAGNTASVDVTPPTGNQTYQVIYTQGTCSDTAYKTARVFSGVQASAGPNQTFCLPVASTITIGGNPTASSGSGIYRYSWSPVTGLNSATVANPTLTASSAGTTIYTVTVTDTVTGCTSISSMTLVINPTATVTIAPGDTDLCSGQNTTLTAIGSPAGGSYQWSPTFNMNPGLGNTASVIVAPSGTQRYQVTYTANGCSGSTAVTVNVYTPVVAHAGIDQSFCLPYAGNIFLGSSSAATGGSGSYSYHWSPTTNLSDSLAPNPIVTKVNMNVEYHLTVTDNVTGCTAVDSSHLSIDTHATLSIAASDTNLCFGQCATLSAVVSPTGGTYQWVPVVYLNPGTGNTQSVTVCPVTNQNYQLVYTRNGCRDTAYQNINVYPVVVAHSGGNQTYCLPVAGNVTLGAVSTATGGSGSYTYAWYPNINLNDSTSSNPALDSVVAGTRTYYVQVTDAVTGCSATDSMVLSIQPHVTVTITSPQTSICVSEAAILTASGIPAGGNYQWNPLVAMVPANGNAATVAVSPAVGSQTYFVYYNLNGCKDTASILVRSYAQPVVNAGGNQSFCLPVTGVVRVGNVATGGSGSFSYHWTPAKNVSDSTAPRPRVDSVLQSGSVTYTVLVTDLVTGCTALDSAVITINAKPHITITSPDTNLCTGQSTTLTASAVPTGGTFHWSPSIAMTPPSGNAPTVTVAPANTQIYQVIYGTLTTFVNEDGDTITQSTGCGDTAYQTVHVYTIPVANAGADQTYCLPIAGVVKLGATPAATGGSGQFKYTWAPSTNLNDTTLANPVLTTVVTNTVYYLTVTDTVSGCSAVDSVHIIINPQASVSIAAADTDICIGQCVPLTATGAPTGGTYQWSPTVSMTPGAGNTASVTVCPSTNQTYQVIYNRNGCRDTAYTNIKVYPLVAAHAGGNQSFCLPVSGTVTLGTTPSATGGSGHYIYLWSPSTNLSDSSKANPTVADTAAFNIVYHLTVTDSVSGCSAVDSARIIISPAASVTVSSADTDLCAGQNTTLTAVGLPAGGTYQWVPTLFMTPSTGTSASVSVAPPATQTYTVTYTLANCNATATKTVNVYSSPVAHAGPDKSFCPPTTSIQIGQVATGGSGSYTYLWASSPVGFTSTSATPTVTPTSALTTYYVTATDAISGCTSTDSVIVIKHSSPPVDAGQDKGICVGSSTQLIATGALTYQWAPSGAGMTPSNGASPIVTVAPVATTTYSVTGTDVYGCTASDTVQVVISSNLIVHVRPVTLCDHDTAYLIPNLQGANFRYQWTPGTGLTCVTCATPLASPPPGNNVYTVTITDTITGCTGSDTVSVVVHRLPNAQFRADVSCFGDSTHFTDLSTSAATDPIASWYYNFGDTATAGDTSHLRNPAYLYTPYIASGHDAYQMVTTIYGCSDTAHALVNTFAPIVTTAGPDTTIGFGNSVNLGASGGTSFTWSPAAGLSATNIPNPTATPLVTTTYYVTVTLGTCSSVDSVTIVVARLPDVQAGPDTFVCAGNPIQLQGFSKTAGATFQWLSPAGVILDSPNTARPIAVSNFPGVYMEILKVTYFTQGVYVSAYDTMFLTVNPIPVITATPDSVSVCSGTPYHITLTSSLPGTSYTWTADNATSGTGSNITDTVFNNTMKDSLIHYTIVGTVPGGCTDTITVPVVVKPIPSIALSSTPAEQCSGTNYVAVATSSNAGAVISWFTNTGPRGTGSSVNQLLINPGTTQQMVIFTYNATFNGCTSPDLNDTVYVNPLPRADAGPDMTTPACSTDSILIGGSPTASGGTPGYTYLWSPVAGITGYTTSANPYVQHLGANTPYTVTVTDSKGCTATDQMVVTVTPPSLAITISVNGSLTYCEGSGSSVDFTVNVTGGAAPYKYLWSPSAFLSDTFSQVVTASPNTAGTYPYTVNVTDAVGCQASLSKTVTVKPLPHPVITGLDTVYCTNTAAVPLTASIPGGVFSGAGVVSVFGGYQFRPASIGAGTYVITYSVTLNGCAHDTSQVVTVLPNATVSITGNSPSYCTLDSATTFTGTPAGGTWSGPGINPTTGLFNPALVTVPNNISRIITIRYRASNAGGCGDSASVNITIYKSLQMTITATADTICQGGSVVLTPHYPFTPLVNNIQWFDVNGTFITNSLNAITVRPTRPNHGYYAVISSLQGCVSNDTISIHVNQSPVANDDYDSTCLNTPFTFDVTTNDTDPEHNGSIVRILNVKYGTASVVTNNVHYTPVYGYHGLDTITYQICNISCSSDCDTAQAFLYICPQNLPPTADTIRYTAFQNAPHDVNVLLATSDPNGDPLTISVVGTYDPTLTVTQTSNGAYTITGTTVGTYPIVYQVCDTDQYPIHVLCDTAVIFANIIPVNTLINHPPQANNDYATTTGIQPAIVNVRGNDTDPDGNPLSIPALSSSSVTAHGHYSVNADGTVTFQPNSGLPQGIYYDTVNYCIYDITTIAPQPLQSCAILVVTTNVIDVVSNRPPVAVDDHVTIAENAPATINVKGNDSDPDGDNLGTPAVLTPTANGTITSVSSNGNVVYVPNNGVHSINGQPVDSFIYAVCDTLALHGPSPLCDTAKVYVYVTPANLPPTADTIRYTQLVGTPHDVNVLLAVSDPNSDPLTITITNIPAGSGLTVTQTGNGAYTITGSIPGTYTITYQVCDTDQYPVHVLCATSVIVATITPPGGPVVNHPPVANNDYATTTGTTPATVNVRGNDSDPDGNPLTIPTLIGGTHTGPGTFSVNADGTITLVPNSGLAGGIYYNTVAYQVCDITTIAPQPLCDTAYVTVTDNVIDTPVANRPPLAVDDHLTVAQNSSNNGLSVKANDSDPDGDQLGTPTIISGVSHGTITAVTPDSVFYTPFPYLHSINGQPVDQFTYVICDTLSAHGPAPLCDTATAYIYVDGKNLPPVANDIYLSTPENTPLGVNVASGAYDPNGDPLTYTYPGLTTSSQGGTVITTGNGSVNYFPPTGFTGLDQFTYSVCDTSPYLIHVLCDTATVFINVTNPADSLVNHPPVATDDHTVTVPGASININVVANDNDPDGNPITVTGVSTTSLGGTVSIGINNTVNYTAPTTVADSIVTDTFSYVICDSSIHPVTRLCDTALVFIVINKFDTNIININKAPVAADDFSTICEEEYSIVNVLNNDIDPNGDVLTVTSIITAPTHGIAAVSSPSIVYIPALYFHGHDLLEYKVCDSRNPALCDTAWVYYTVNLINHRPLAAQDTTSVYMNASVNVPVTINDFEPDGDSTTLAVVTPPIHGTAVQVGNTYTYIPTPGYAGDDTFYYRVCDVQNPTATYCATYTQQCDVGLVSIHILHHPPHVPPTYDTIPMGTPPVTICPLVSDTDHNSVHVTSFPCGPFHGTVGFATSDSCLTYVPAHDYVGNDSFCVVYCDNVVPTLCDTGKVYITITPLCIPPVAVVDSYTVFHLASSATLNVTANDTNHTTSALAVSVLTQPTPLGIAVVSGTNVRFTPSGTVGQGQFLYSICSVNPVCTICDTGIVYINVTGTTSTPPVAVNDSARIPQDSSVCVRVVTNDIAGSSPFSLTSACTPSHGTNSIAANGTICYVPTHGFFGTDSFCYTICDNSVPQLCSTATVIVTVTPNPHPPVAVNDYATTPAGRPVVICVANNDSDPDGNLNIHSVSPAVLPNPPNFVTNIDSATGCITYVPDSNAPAGIDSFKYSICDSTPVIYGGPLCATATVYVTVTTLNHPPFAPNDTVTVPEDSMILVCPAFSDPDPGQTAVITSVCAPTHGTAVITGPTCVNYTPTPSFFGIDSFCYVVCDNGSPSLCDTGIITVIVTRVPHCPLAVKDFANAQATVPVVINELFNDLNVGTIGVGYSVTIVSGPIAGNTAVVNPNGTITYTAAAGFSGIDVITYKITDSLDNCSTAVPITIFVGNTCVGPIAADDNMNVCGGGILSADVLANDYLGNTGFDTLTVLTTGSHGFAYVNTTTHRVDYVPAILYHGPDTVTYQVCNMCPSGVMCSTGVLAINVLITNHAPVAVDDTATMVEDHSDTINVVANDYDVDGDPLTVSISAQPTFGTLRVDNNQLIYTPFPNYCGTDTFGYQVTGLNGSPLCPGQRAWDLGLVFVNITCVNDTPVIPDTLVHVPEDSIITVCVPYTDPDKGDHHTATVLCAPMHGVLVSTSTASDTPAVVCQTYKPDSNFYGVDSICVILCDNGTPALCDTSHIVIIVDPRNEPPVVADQHVSTPKGQPVGVNISTGAYDPNGDPITYTYPGGLQGPQHGTWVPDTHNNGAGVYTPNPNDTCARPGVVCQDQFTVIVCDNSPFFIHVLCDTATVFVSIYDTTGTPNHPPVANTDYAVTDTSRPIIVYVAANDLDPDGDMLTVPTILDSTTHGTIGYNASNQLVYTPVGPFTSALTADSFKYAICDTLSAHNPQHLCDTATAYITINYLDSPSIHTNQPPVAVDDNATTQYGHSVTIPVLHNDSDPNGDPIHVTTTILPGDSVAQYGTVTVNADGTITYAPFVGPGLGPNAHRPDVFYYVICDTSASLPHSLCDTARVIVTVPNSVQAVADVTLTGNSVPVTINVKANDYDPELDSFYIVGTVSPALHGTAVLTDTVRGIYTYTPNGTVCSVTGGIVDSFTYAVRDTLGAMDTATVYIRVKCCSVVAADDTFNIYQGDTLTAGILINDGLDPSIPHHITFSNTATVHGTLTVRGDSVIYAPDSGYCGTAYFEYVVSDTCGRDTANVNIHITCANIHAPTLVNDTISLCINTDTLINVLRNDYDIDSNIVAIDTFSQGANGGRVTLQSGQLLYRAPTPTYVGKDSFTYSACDNGVPVLCSTATVYLDIHKCSPPITVDTLVRDTVLACSDTNHICIDSIYQGAGYTLHFAGICDSTHHGVIFVDTTMTTTGVYGTLCFSYLPNCDTTAGGTGYVGNDTACIIICNTGVDTSCTTVHVIITVLPKPPVDSVWANNDVTYTCDALDTIKVLANDGFAPNPGNPLTGTAIHIVTAGANAGLAPHLGIIAIVDSTIIYTPNPSETGTDTFKYVIADNGNPQQFDTAIVVVYVCEIPTPIAVDDNQSCRDTTSLVNTPGIINVLANDTLFFATDTVVTVVVAPVHGQTVVNANFTVTFTPDSGFHGNDNFQYSVCESVGPLTTCDTASVCINVIDTVTPCFFPNGFSPNGDQVNDKFVFPCADNFPNATLRVYNRWGDGVWQSQGGYKNDWDGNNQTGQALPDGTYYFIYQYNDGSGKSEARFVVIHRGEK